MGLTLDHARTIIAAARAAGREDGMKPLSVVVLDAGGHVTAFEREDGSSNKRFEIAYGKAHGALAFGLGSRALMARAEQQPYFIAAGLEVPNDTLLKVTPLIRERLVTLDDSLAFARFFFEEDIHPNPEDLVAKGLDAKQSAAIARRAYEILSSLPEISHAVAEPPMRDPKSGKFRHVWVEKESPRKGQMTDRVQESLPVTKVAT